GAVEPGSLNIFMAEVDQFLTTGESEGVGARQQGFPTLNLQTKIGLLQQKTQAAEQKAFEAKRMADLAERDAREKDKELAETLIHLRAYESGIYGLENAVAEIKECKHHIKIRDHQIEAMTKEINKLEMKINDLLDENENFRQRLGLDTNEIIDLGEFRKTKYLKQQQFQAENQVLLKEIERLEEERLVLKRQIRRMAQDKGMRAGVGGISAEDLGLVDSFNERINTNKETELSSSVNFELNHKNRQIRGELLNKEGAYQNAEFELAKLNRQIMQNEYISRELEVKEKELEEMRTEVAQLNAKLKQLVEENKQFESGMKDILQAIKSTQVETISKGGEEILKIESLEKLVT
ncbi:centrosomal protein of 290 kDa-like, partial [Rhincodon typus]|uniref:centrosomal protein of 290 kDa-like n=1 Tax=Rhincodon typus TaxID=259920 RepID=UPI00202E60AC